MEDDVSRVEQYDKSDTGSDDMYDDTRTDTTDVHEENDDEFLGFELILLILVGLMRVRLQVGLLILKTDASYTRVYTVSDKK